MKRADHRHQGNDAWLNVIMTSVGRWRAGVTCTDVITSTMWRLLATCDQRNGNYSFSGAQAALGLYLRVSTKISRNTAI